MSEIRKQGIANSIVSFIGVGLGYFYSALLGPYILTPDQIGLTSTLLAVALITSHVARLGGPYLAIRFYPFFRESANDRKSFFSFLLMLTAVGFLLFLMIYLLSQSLIIKVFSTNSSIFVDYNLLVIPLVFFMSFFDVLHGYARAMLVTILPAVLRDIVWRLLIIAALLAYYFKLIDFNAFVWLYALGYALPLLVIVLYLLASGDIGFSTHIDLKGKRNELLKYGQFVLLGTLATSTINEVDKVMIALLAGLKATGIYQVAAFFSIVIQIPARSVIAIAAPIVAGFIANNEMDKVERVYQKSSVNQLIAGLFLFVGIYINLDNIFRILPPDFAAGRYVIIFIGLSKLFDLVTGINGEIIINSKYYRFDLYFNLALVGLVVGCDLFFIPRYGITGAAIAAAGAIFLYNAAKSWFIWLVYRIQPFTVHTISVIAVGLIVIGINYFLPTTKLLLVDIVYRSTIVTIVYAVLIYASRASEDVNGMVNKALGKM